MDNRRLRLNGRRENQFKLEELGTKYEECADLITRNEDWEGEIAPLSSLSNNLKKCSPDLSKWGKT